MYAHRVQPRDMIYRRVSGACSPGPVVAIGVVSASVCAGKHRFRRLRGFRLRLLRTNRRRKKEDESHGA